MFGRVMRTWSELEAARPGRRFRQHYKRHHRAARTGAIRKAVLIIAGAALIVLGIVGLVLPGPGIPAIALGGALVASESYAAAAALDTLELRARRALRRWFS